MVRLKDVAAHAGVSIGTASKVLNGNRTDLAFSEDCVRRVRRAARELGYTPNYLARSLQTGRSYALGLVLGNPGGGSAGGFYSRMIDGLMGRAHALGYHLVTIGSARGSSAVGEGLAFLGERRVDALVVPAFTCGWRVPADLLEAAAPVVLTNFVGETRLPSVELEEVSGIAAAVDHLRGLGHRRLLWVGVSGARHPSGETRRSAFWQAAETPGLEAEELLLPLPSGRPYGLESEVAQARDALLARAGAGLEATGLVCYEESIAQGAYAALSELGLRVPQDVSVIGFDDIYAPMAWPPMTVVSHMLEQIGQAAAEMAVQMVEDGPDGDRDGDLCRRIPAELVIRKSTGPAPV